MASLRSSGKVFLRRLADYSIHLLSFMVFAIFDLVDQVLCPVFAFLDWHLDRHEAPCYCHQTPSSSVVDKKEQLMVLKNAELAAGCEFWSGPSDTLYGRKHKQGRNRVHFLALHRTLSADAVESTKDLRGKSGRRISSERFQLGSVISDEKSSRKPLLDAVSDSELSSLLLSSEVVTESAVPQKCKNDSAVVKARWSDCGCSTCTAWQANGDLLHVHVDGKGLASALALSISLVCLSLFECLLPSWNKLQPVHLICKRAVNVPVGFIPPYRYARTETQSVSFSLLCHTISP